MNLAIEGLPFIPPGRIAPCSEPKAFRVFNYAGEPHKTNANGRPSRSEQRALLICQGCPLLDACRDYAMTTRQSWGVWGGLTLFQKERIWRAEYHLTDEYKAKVEKRWRSTHGD